MRRTKIRYFIVVGVMLGLLVAACSGKKPAANFQSNDQKTVEAYQTTLTNAAPYPVDQMKDSLERHQLTERLLRFNKPTKIAYINLFSDMGQVIASLPVKGKVSSVNSMLTTTNQVQKKCNGDGTNCEAVVLESPNDDGSYGPNGDAVFFFTTEDVYVEWNGKYLLTDAPLKVESATVITYDKSSKPSSTGTGG